MTRKMVADLVAANHRFVRGNNFYFQIIQREQIIHTISSILVPFFGARHRFGLNYAIIA